MGKNAEYLLTKKIKTILKIDQNIVLERETKIFFTPIFYC